MLQNLQPCTRPLLNWGQLISASCYTRKQLLTQCWRRHLKYSSDMWSTLPNLHLWSPQASLHQLVYTTIHNLLCLWDTSKYALQQPSELWSVPSWTELVGWLQNNRGMTNFPFIPHKNFTNIPSRSLGSAQGCCSTSFYNKCQVKLWVYLVVRSHISCVNIIIPNLFHLPLPKFHSTSLAFTHVASFHKLLLTTNSII